MTIRIESRVVAALVWLGVTVLVRHAAAQGEPSLDLRTWRPSIDPETSLVLEPTGVPCRWCWNVAAWSAYAQDPVTVRDASAVALRPVAHQLVTDVTAGVGLGARIAIGVDLPFVAWQNGSTETRAASSGGSPEGPGSLEALGDISLRGKLTMISNDWQGLPIGLGLAAVGAVSLPTGSRSSYAGEGAATASLQILGEYALGAAALRASIGFALRPDWRAWSPDLAMAPVTFGDSVLWAAGLTVRPKAFAPVLDGDDRQRWELAAHGALPAGPVAPFGLGAPGAAAESPALLALDDRVSLGHYRDVYLLLGAEVGLDAAVGVPSFRGVLSLGWAPRTHDRDADGIPDDVDQCPDLPEDKDGIQDDDGCPEDDADGDGIPDDQDACPLVAGPPSTDARSSGCPPSKGASARPESRP